jgi:methanesulfonate monooxygenase small subunit
MTPTASTPSGTAPFGEGATNREEWNDAMSTSAHEEVRDAIYRAALALDGQRWDEWLALCEDDFYYAIQAYSPEIRREMIYLDGRCDALQNMMDMLPKHNTDESPLTRHTVVYQVEMGEDGQSASAISSVVVYHTIFDGRDSHLEAGSSCFFLVGKYRDWFRLRDGRARFVEWCVCLENRRLDKGSHWPI